MNDDKLKKLFSAARNELSSTPSIGFDADVMRAIRREEKPAAVTIFDQLNQLFPRLAWAAAIVIVACVAGEFLTSLNSPSLTDDVSQLSEQWLFASQGF